MEKLELKKDVKIKSIKDSNKIDQSNILLNSTYSEKIVQIRRVTKVVKGGKKMTFRAIVIVGDKKTRVGVGIGRAEDVNLAIDKAILNGKKNLIKIPLTLNYSIPHVIKSKFGASQIMLRPATEGTGVITGGAMRTVLELGGIRNILGKQRGSNSILNNVKATILALSSLNEKIDLGKFQSSKRYNFYNKIMKKEEKVLLFKS
jgi:small subunit ribosomal protein S5